MATSQPLTNTTNAGTTKPADKQQQQSQQSNTLKSPTNKREADLGVPFTVLRADMQQQHIKDILVIIRDGFVDSLNDQQIATKIKTACDTAYAATYHVIVGKSFSTCISYDTYNMLFVNMHDRNVLVFKSIE